MTLDPVLYRRLQERSDRLERQARIIGDAFYGFAEELAGLGRDLAQLETANGQEAPEAEAAPHRFTWEPPARHEPIRLQPLGVPCPNHPGEVIGAFGCPACNAGKRWLERGQVAQVGVGSRP